MKKAFKVWLAKVGFLLALFLLLAFFVLAMVVLSSLKGHAAHSLTELRDKEIPIEKVCPVPDPNQPEKVIAAGYDIQLRVYWRVLDTNLDNKPDMFVEYDIYKVEPDRSIKSRPFPTRYFLDTDGDGYYDKFYHDVKGDGRCEDIVPFQPAEQDPKLPL